MKKLAIRLGIYFAVMGYFWADVNWFHGPLYHLMRLDKKEPEAQKAMEEVYAAKVYGVMISKAEIEAVLAIKFDAEDLQSPVMHHILYSRALHQRIDDELLYFNAKYFRGTLEEKEGRTLNRDELCEVFLEEQWQKRGEEFDDKSAFQQSLMDLYRHQAGDKFEVYAHD